MLFGQQEVMRRNLAGHAQSVAPRLPHRGQRRGRRGVRHVQMSVRVAQLGHQANVALHHARFGLRRHAAQPQLERHRPQIHAGALRQRVSSACWITLSPTRAAAASVSRIMLSFRIGWPSSVTATAPADLSAA